MENEVDTLVIGAGPSGLAVAACLKQRGVSPVIVERAATVASSWRRHYGRLHLHTARAHSALPHLSFPAGTPRYPSREKVVEYLEAYARHFELMPHFGEEVQAVRSANGGWTTITSADAYHSRCVVVATGYCAGPYVPRWPGQERFVGRIVHSGEYRNGEPFRGQRVLVIGFGNSGGEIAIDLHEHGAHVAVSVRGPVNIIPRDVAGLSVQSLSIALGHLPTRLADALAKPLARVVIGDITRLGFRKLDMGPITQIRQTRRVPLIDVGTVKLIREGHVDVLAGVEAVDETTVSFEDGSSRGFDAIILATGFRPQISRFLEAENNVLTPGQAPPRRGAPAKPGLYFCGFVISPTGMLREIGIEAQRIAEHIAMGAQSANR
jgi:cation diffusion facilitator CzcD-associated flavoprotein CzcO